MYAPMTLPMLAALAPTDCYVSIIDEKVEDIDIGLRPDLVGITAITPSANRSYELAQQFRDRGCTVVMGGPHPTVRPDEALKYADAVVIGQAYKSWPQCIEDVKRGELKRKYIDDHPAIKHIPIPKRELLKCSRYITANSVQATLGCPHRCEFCIVPEVFGSSFMTRAIEEIIEEIKRLKGRNLFFLDVNLIADKSFSKELFKHMIPLKKRWAAQVTVGFTEDLELLDLAAQSGCRGVFLGVESLNQASLMETKKGFNNVRYYAEMQRKLRDHGIRTMMGIVYGFDHDDPTIFDKTMRFMDQIKADTVRYGILTPFPGTPLFRRFEDDNRIIDYNWRHYDTAHVVFAPSKMTPDQLQQGFYRSMNHTYSIRSILKRIFGTSSILPAAILVNYGFYSETKRLYRKYRDIRRNGIWNIKRLRGFLQNGLT
jgi:radical SAM superfamily enzyme YgiQ (UPF0313 family)